ncbi:3-deoxy-D-manno-octulosonic acid transferase [Pelagibius litoralis]|uniref:3-deoxy-D-manno-octulosonic acid transferase n=1 Tax=Pelagibius litoralis TaxID=374515 RepID=A0A967C9D6_9PROT|nr:3-deoxy-D-manno-octulosonic acid transferase [Pelagibius litoralis]NIA69022.1 3-deoxy-D-manno-octulosonic acid transferase [Pelagibius litoralis]
MPPEAERSDQGKADRGRDAGGLGSTVARTVFAGYRLLTGIGAPLVRTYLRRRLTRGREDPFRIEERLGRTKLARPEGPLVWLHAASVGETVSLLPLIERLQREQPALSLLMTSGTVTSAKLMAERLPAGVIHQYVPVDLPGAVAGFLDHWRPALGIMVESEFWPNLIRSASQAGTELVLLNGRVSPASYRSWRRVRPLIAELLGHFSLVMARSPQDQAHLRDLGAGDTLCAGDLKAAAPPLSADPAALERLRAEIAGRPLWLAASTHSGEDEIVAQVHRMLTALHPSLLTLIVPRHPNRAEAIREILEAKQLTVAQRSRGEAITGDTDIYLADTMGEMGLWYHLANIVFVGGSLVPTGGHNLLEPAKLDCAVLTGPHTTNFSQMAEGMQAAGALCQVADEGELQKTLATLLADTGRRDALAATAAGYADRQADVLGRVMKALDPLLQKIPTA